MTVQSKIVYFISETAQIIKATKVKVGGAKFIFINQAVIANGNKRNRSKYVTDIHKVNATSKENRKHFIMCTSQICLHLSIVRINN